jgi:ferredoxin
VDKAGRACYLHPACEPACPVQAIFPQTEVPSDWASYIDKNRSLSEKK